MVLLEAWKKIIYIYNWVKDHQLYFTIYIVTLVCCAFTNKAINSTTFSLSELLGRPLIFLWTMIICSIFWLLYGLIPIKPFKIKIDYFIIVLILGVISYSVPGLYFAWITLGTFAYLLLICIVFVVYYLLRGIVYSCNKAYMNKARDLFYSNRPRESKGLFKPDKVIKNISDDALSRKGYSESLAEAIIAYQEEESLVIGLTGEWGSGKSSIIKMMLEFIKKKSQKEYYARPVIVEFNPWNFSDQNQLIEQFFKTLSTVLSTQSDMPSIKNLGDKLNAYSNIFKAITMSQGQNIPKLIQSLIGMVLDDDSKKNLKEIKEEIDIALRNNPGKIIVVIDDIDRLTAPEIRQIFQLIKSIADFSNTVYFLAFDKKIVVDNLSSEQQFLKNEDGSKYLEKIVQVFFDIPTGNKVQIERILLSQLNNIRRNCSKALFDQMYWANVYIDGIKQYIKNLRDVTRYLNTVRFQYGLIKESVNVVDFFAIVALQVFDYEVYCMVRDNKALLAGGWRESSDQTEEKKQIERLCSKIIGASQENAISLIRRLFPKLELIYSNTCYTNNFLSEWRRNGRICHPEIFDLYFRLILDEEDISQTEMQEIIKSFENEQQIKNNIEQLLKKRRLVRFLELLEDYTTSEQDIPDSSIEDVMYILLDMGDNFPKETTDGFFAINTDLRIARIIYQLSSRIKNQNKRDEMFLRVFKKVKNSLYPLVYNIYLFDQQHGRYGLKENPEPKEGRIVSEYCLDELEKLGLEMIRKWTQNDNHIFYLKYFKEILIIWQTWASKEEVKKYINDNELFSDSNLPFFMIHFINDIKIQSANNYLSEKQEVFDMENFKMFIDDDVYQLVDKAKAILHCKHIPSVFRKPLELFLDQVDKMNKSENT